MLEIKDLSLSIQQRHILKDISLSASNGEILGIIGPNGCGKTTLLNTISGFHAHDRGQIFIDGKEISRTEPHIRARTHIGRSFQNVGVFKDMTLAENMILVLEKEKQLPWWWMFDKQKKSEMYADIQTSLTEVGLEKYIHASAGILSGGQLRLLELARLKRTNRPLLLIDEPTAGVAPALRNKLSDMLRSIASEQNRTILLVEHDLKFLFNLVNRVIVIVDGSIHLMGKPEEVQNDAKLREIYLGN